MRRHPLWTAGVVETLTDEKLAEVGGDGAPKAADVVAMIVHDHAQAGAGHRPGGRHRGVPGLRPGHGITATNANVTCGLVLGSDR